MRSVFGCLLVGNSLLSHGVKLLPYSYQLYVNEIPVDDNTSTAQETSNTSSLDETDNGLSSLVRGDDSAVTRDVDWNVYVDQSKYSLERGGRATLDAFLGLSPPQYVQVHPAIFPKGKKAPVVRCVYKSVTNGKEYSKVLEMSKVDSVDKVFRTLTKHMWVKGVKSSTREVLKLKYKANEYLQSGDISAAIATYDSALECGVAEQEGILLLGRATAYQRRASIHKKKLQELVADLDDIVPETIHLQQLYEVTAQNPTLSKSVFQRVLKDTKAQEKSYQQTKYRHGLYQYALLHATQDSLRATQLLPTYSKALEKAGEILSELWKIKESSEYYEMAAANESALQKKSNIKEELVAKQNLLDNVRAYGWSEDILRLVLDVAELQLD